MWELVCNVPVYCEVFKAKDVQESDGASERFGLRWRRLINGCIDLFHDPHKQATVNTLCAHTDKVTVQHIKGPQWGIWSLVEILCACWSLSQSHSTSWWKCKNVLEEAVKKTIILQTCRSKWNMAGCKILKVFEWLWKCVKGKEIQWKGSHQSLCWTISTYSLLSSLLRGAFNPFSSLT